MENIKLEGTDICPEIDFDYSSNRFMISGFSYPENVRDFYGPVIGPLTQYLDALEGGSVEFIIEFNYFHSSSAQVLYNLFDTLEKCAEKGNSITVTWGFEAGDDNMEEAGEDFAEDMEHVNFTLREIGP